MSLLSDGDSSNSSESAAASLMFGSHTVAPNSPTPYTDATQVRGSSLSPSVVNRQSVDMPCRFSSFLRNRSLI